MVTTTATPNKQAETRRQLIGALWRRQRSRPRTGVDRSFIERLSGRCRLRWPSGGRVRRTDWRRRGSAGLRLGTVKWRGIAGCGRTRGRKRTVGPRIRRPTLTAAGSITTTGAIAATATGTITTAGAIAATATGTITTARAIAATATGTITTARAIAATAARAVTSNRTPPHLSGKEEGSARWR
jgi:hypothetical protein